MASSAKEDLVYNAFHDAAVDDVLVKPGVAGLQVLLASHFDEQKWNMNQIEGQLKQQNIKGDADLTLGMFKPFGFLNC